MSDDSFEQDLKTARLAEAAMKAQAQRLELDKKRGVLVDRAAAEGAVAELAREERQAFEGFVRDLSVAIADLFHVSADEVWEFSEERLADFLARRSGSKVTLDVS